MPTMWEDFIILLPTWDEAISAKLYSIEGEFIQPNSCVCHACEKYIKRNITSENYKPRSHQEACVKCILPDCIVTSTKGSIVHTSVATTQQIPSVYSMLLLAVNLSIVSNSL